MTDALAGLTFADDAKTGRRIFTVDQITTLRARYRTTDDPDVKKLAASMKVYGQLQPIIIETNGELIDGGRRLAAAKALGWETIWGVFKLDVDVLLAKTLELETNIQRLDMDWKQRARAIAELDTLRKQQNPNWSQEMTVAEAGLASQSDVSDALKITKMMELFPEIAEAKSLHQAKSWSLAKAAQIVRAKEVKDGGEELRSISDRIILGNSVEVIKSLPEGLARAVITDPPFGIDYEHRKAGTEGSMSAYQDDEQSYERLLSMAPDIYKVLKPDGWLVWFLGPTWWERAKNAFREAGFTVDEIPIIWYRKGGRSFTTRPDRYFGRHYDMALHALKGDPQMVVRGRSNVFEFAPVEGADRELLVERPVELYAELIRCLTVPGETVVDFFTGSGSVLAAAASLKRNYLGVELDPIRRAHAIRKVAAHEPTE